MRVLLAMNDTYFGTLLQRFMNDVEIEVVRVGLAEEAFDLLMSEHFDCFVLERDLPDQNGAQMLLDIPEDNQTPILFVMNSPKGTLTVKEQNIVIMNADALIIRPFTRTEFIEMLVGVTDDTREEPESMIFYDALSIDTATHQVFFEHKPMNLDPVQSALLEYLVQHSETLVKNDDLRAAIFGEWNPQPTDKQIDDMIQGLGDRLYEVTGHRYVHSMPGRGQRIWNPPWMRSLILPKNSAARRTR